MDHFEPFRKYFADMKILQASMKQTLREIATLLQEERDKDDNRTNPSTIRNAGNETGRSGR